MPRSEPIEPPVSTAATTATGASVRPWLKWALLIAITIGLCAILVERVDWTQFAGAMKLARVPLIALAGFVAVTLCMWGCIERLMQLLQKLPRAGEPLSRWELASIQYAASAAHNLLPAPAGEVLRTVQLKRRHGYGLGVLVAAQLVEKVIEALGLGLEILVVAIVSPLRATLGVSLYVFAGVSVGGALVALVAARRFRARHAGEAEPADAPAPRGVRGHAAAFARRLGEGLYLVRSPRTWVVALFWSCVSDLSNAATVGLVLAALGLHLPVAAWFLVMLAARMAGLFPSTPGQFGVQEAAVVVVLRVLGIDDTHAFAVAILHHVAHFVPVTAVGLWELRRQWIPKAAAAT
jgi:glycosyltransferase 2 family protein